MASTYEPIATYTIPSAQASYTFTSISGAYTDLVLVGAFTTDYPCSINLNMGNGSIDTGSNFSWTYLRGNGSSATSSRGSSDTRIFSGQTSTSDYQANIILNVENYSNTTTYKTSISRFNETSMGTQATVGLWRSTSAINQIRLTAAGGANFQPNSTFTLYGIKAA